MTGHLREYHRPGDWKMAEELFSRNDLLLRPLFHSPKPLPQDQWPEDLVVDLTNLGLESIKEENGFLKIGSLSSLQSIIDSQLVKNLFDGIICKCASYSGPLGMRNYANLGGVLTNINDPSELLLSLLVLDAEVLVRSFPGILNSMAITSFLDSNRGSEIREVIYGIQIPLNGKGMCSINRLARTRGDASIIAVAARLVIEDGVINAARIAVSGASSHPERVKPIEDLLTDKILTPELMELVSLATEDWANPCNDLRGSSEYRKAMLRVIVRRAIQTAWVGAI